MWREAIIWILLWESGSVNSLILFEHGYGPLYYMQGSRQSNGIFDQHRKHNSSNTLAIMSRCQTSQPSFLFFYFNQPDVGKRREKKFIEHTVCVIFFFLFVWPDLLFLHIKDLRKSLRHSERNPHQDVPSPFPLMCNISDRLTADKKNNKKSQLVYWGPVTCLTPSTHVHSCQRWLDDMVEIYSLELLPFICTLIEKW